MWIDLRCRTHLQRSRLAGPQRRVEKHRARDALAAHASQLTEGIRFFEEFLTKDAAEAGAKIGVDYAEKFRLLDLS